MVNCTIVKDEDGVDLQDGDFRRLRRYLAPHLFAWPDEDEADAYPPPTDLVPEEQWDHLMTLPTDVALKSSSYEGSTISAWPRSIRTGSSLGQSLVKRPSWKRSAFLRARSSTRWSSTPSTATIGRPSAAYAMQC